MGIPCCTSCATLLAAEIMLSQAGYNIKFSRLFLYYMTRARQGRVGLQGTDLNSTLETFTNVGVSTNSSWPYIVAYTDLEPTPTAINEAAYNKISSYKRINCNDFKKYLDDSIPIIVGMKTGSLFWKLTGDYTQHNYKPINDTDNIERNGHAVTIIGYDDLLNGGSWIISNSTSIRWGFRGIAAIPYSCVQDMYECYVITDLLAILSNRKFFQN